MPDLDKRWRALLVYNTDQGPQVRDVYFEEIEELHDIVEEGPDFHTLINITVVQNSPVTKTIEQSLLE